MLNINIYVDRANKLRGERRLRFMRVFFVCVTPKLENVYWFISKNIFRKLKGKLLIKRNDIIKSY